MWHDEALSHFYASQPVEWILKYSAGPINHPPLFFLLLKVWISIVPPFSQLLVETMNLIFGVATIGIVYRWTEFLYTRTIALWLTLILALNGFHVHYTTELRMYALATFGLTVAGYFATRLIVDRSITTTELVGFILGLVVSAYAHSFTVIPVVIVALSVGYELYDEPDFKLYLIGLTAFIIAYLPWGIYAFNQGVKVSRNFWIPDFYFTYFGEFLLISGGFIGPKNLSIYSVMLSLSILVGFFGPMIFSLLSLRDSVIWIYWFVIVVPIAFVVIISWRDQSVFVHRIFLPLVPFMVVLVGAGIKNLPEGWAVICISLYVLALSSEVFLLKKNPPKQHLKKVSSWIQQEYQNDSIVVHDSARSYFPARFYHQGMIQEFLYGGPEHFRGISSTELQRLLRHKPIMAIYRGTMPKWIRSIPEESIRSFSSMSVGGRRYAYAVLDQTG